MAYKLRLPGTFTDADDLSVRRDDPILPEAGALVLLDMSTIGGTTVPLTYTNIAARQAAVLLGEAEDDMVLTGATIGSPDPAKFLMERSAKGGLHGISSATMSPFPGTTGYAVNLPADVLTYLFAHVGDIYYSIWSRTTRAGSNASTEFEVAQSSSAYLTAFTRSNPVPSVNLQGKPGTATPTAGTPYIRTTAPTAAQGSPVAGSSVARLCFGKAGPYATGSGIFNPGCVVFYRLYIEDIDVSGRSIAEIYAKDQALFDEAFASGGRFYNDSYTNPTTIP